MLKKIYWLLLLIPFQLFGQIPDYYIGIDFTQNGENLKNQLSNLIIATHSNDLSYTPGVWNAIKETDLDPDNPNDNGITSPIPTFPEEFGDESTFRNYLIDEVYNMTYEKIRENNKVESK